jgi:ppGpp synthetase/RelA/SpoT-type nucleotidyltranferase
VVENRGVSELTRSQADRAGKRIRHAVQQGRRPAESDIAVVVSIREQRFAVVARLRELLVEVAASLAPEGVCEIAPRPKTVESIVAKLARSTITLSGMQDVAGARLVVPTLAIQAAALELLTESIAGPVRVKDTREPPDPLGYRALHLIVGQPLAPGEIQLRTVRQHL